MRVEDALELTVKANRLLADQQRALEQTAKPRKLIEEHAPRKRVAMLFDQLGMGFEPEVIAEAYSWSVWGVGAKPGTKQLASAERFRIVVGIQFHLKQGGQLDIEDRLDADELAMWRDLTPEQRNEMEALEATVQALLSGANQRNMQVSDVVPTKSVCAVRVGVIRATRTRSRRREAGCATNLRTRGSRRVISRSAGGGSSGSDPDLSDPPNAAPLRGVSP